MNKDKLKATKDKLKAIIDEARKLYLPEIRHEGIGGTVLTRQDLLADLIARLATELEDLSGRVAEIEEELDIP